MSPLERLADLPLAMLESHAPAARTVAAGVAGCAWLLAPHGLPMRSLGAVWVAPMFAVAPPQPAQGEAWQVRVDSLAEAVPQVIAAVEKNGAKLRTLTTHEATLEDLFVSLTGRELRDA